MGALLGLLGQEAAFAHVMPVEKAEQTATVTQMNADCAEMMGLAKPQPQPEKQPCQGMTPDCIAKMGCALPLAVATPATVLAASDHSAAPADQLPVSRLRGRTFGPEPDPPLFLG